MSGHTRPPQLDPASRAEVVVPCSSLDKAIAFHTGVAGSRLEMIMPGDAPAVAVVSRDALVLRLEHHGDSDPARLPTSLRLFPILQVDDACILHSFADHELATGHPCELLEVSLPANPLP